MALLSNLQNTIVTGAPQSPDRAGLLLLWGGSTAPTGWALCNGTAISRTTYAELFSVIGTDFGVGDGSTTFNLPSLSTTIDGASKNYIIKLYSDVNGVAVSLGNLTASNLTISGTANLPNGTVLASPAISSPTGLVKADVGLGNVDNTSDVNKPVSTAQQTALNLKANLASPTFTGTVGLPNNTVTNAMLAGSIDLTSKVTGALPAANGGTGQSSYTAGDLLYASAATTISKLAGVATGNALLSGGVGTAPSWGQITNNHIAASAAIDGSKLVAATGSVAGAVTTSAQTFAGAKTFSSAVTGLSFSPTGGVSANYTIWQGSNTLNLRGGSSGILVRSTTDSDIFKIADNGATTTNSITIAGTGSGSTNYSIWQGTNNLLIRGGSAGVTIRNTSDSDMVTFNNNGVYGYNAGTMRAVGVTSTNVLGDTTVSRRELKENFRPLDISGIWSLPVYKFSWKASGDEDVGAIADEVSDLMPDFAVYDEQGTASGVQYHKLAVACIKALQELKAENEALKARIEALESVE